MAPAIGAFAAACVLLPGILGQFPSFALTITPLYLLTLLGLLLSAQVDWRISYRRRPWIIAVIPYVLIGLITSFVHLPLNLQKGAAVYSPSSAARDAHGLIGLFRDAALEDADRKRSCWLLWSDARRDSVARDLPQAVDLVAPPGAP